MLHISNRIISPGTKPFIIAEMSGNHNQSLDRALAIIDAAADCGVDAIKLQTYTPDTITMQGVYKIDDPNSLWQGKELHQLYKEAYTPWEWHEAIFAHANKKGLICFSSPFDESAVDFLEKLNVPAYKIASFENTHYPLLKKVAQTGKPVIMSTGVINYNDLKESVDYLRQHHCNELILLKCTSTYPASPENTNLLTIPDMRKNFNCEVGLSDHTMGIGVAVASVALGAVVIEKHFTLSRADGGVDSAFSMEPQEMKLLVEEVHKAWQALGQTCYEPTEKERKSMFFKRSVYISNDIKKGEKISVDNIKVIRPSLGLPPKYYDAIIGKTVNKDLKKGTPLTFNDIDKWE
jgi:pseudaminic acid synthase